MRIIQTFITIIVLAAFSANLSAAELWGGGFSKLKTRIIRSMAVAPHDQAMIIVGNKGSSAGEAQLFASDDGGVSWRFLNGGRSLAAAATDVQAVSVVSPSVVLAGTWKHGLYRSQDAGVSFNRVNGLAAKDIRSLVTLENGRVVAATGASGIWKSNDAGVNWSASSLSAGFFWSVKSTQDSTLLATSPGKGLYRSTDAGDTWEQIHAVKGLYDATSIDNLIVAVGDNGMIVSQDSGSSWSAESKLSGIRLSSVQTDQNNPGTLVVGGWADGFWEYSIADKSVSHYAKGLPVLHVIPTRQGILVGSWGKGIYMYPREARTEYLVNGARAADHAVIKKLLSDGADPNSFDSNRNTALIFAGRDGLLDIAKLLLSSGADVNWVDGEGVTPLILASFKNHPEVVQLLLANGADKSVVDGFGRTALDYALRRGDSDPIAKALK